MSGLLEIPRGEDYWALTRRPLTSLIFLSPLLVLYEVNLALHGSRIAARNGADVWLRGALETVGCAWAPLLPLLVAGALLIWQWAGKYPWRLSVETLLGMLAESLLFAFLLILFGQLQDLAFQQCQWQSSATGGGGGGGLLPVAGFGGGGVMPRVFSFIGAGVYEEVLFRLCLLPACYGLLRLVRVPPLWAGSVALLGTSLLFSAAHYLGPAGDPFSVYTFTFRASAGLFFALLFVYRGFGIAVGCHAAYDLLVGIVLRS